MKRGQRRQQGKGAFELIEEATHLLRTAPVDTLAIYFLGVIPFVLGLLFYWGDMSRSPLAAQHLAGGSLGMAALFFWMKFWQVIFTRRVRAHAAGKPTASLTIRGCVRIFFTQAIIQPTGLFLLPLAAIPVAPLGWCYAFYQNVTILDDGTETGTAALLKKSRRQAAAWPMQNHVMLAIMFGFGLWVLLNWITVCFALPQLLKMLFGVESDFTRSPLAMLNTTFFAATLALTWLCVDPILKTIYTLRCFYGESLESGEDLRAGLKPFAAPVLKTAALMLVLAAILVAHPVSAGSAPTNNPTTNGLAASSVKPAIPPPDLDHAISKTIHESKYVWRMPREKTVDSDANDGLIAQFVHKIGNLIRQCLKAVLHWLEEILRKLFHRSEPASSGSGYGWIMSLQFLLYGLVAVAIVALALLIFRAWRVRRQPAPALAGEAIPSTPDLADENVRADLLPEDGWIKLARELLERGEYRLAMRAFYLASLAQLAARNLISISASKSNRDYERELRRRAHAFPSLLSVFGDNILAFERIWYGLHETNRQLVDEFAASQEKLKAAG